MFNWIFFASFIILIPVTIAFANIKYIDAAFKPLLINLCIGLVAEALGHLFRIVFQNNMYVINVFTLLDCLTFLWLFDTWGAFSKVKKQYKQAAIFAFIILWVCDNLIFHSLSATNIIFRVAYGLFLVLVALNQLSNVLVKNTSVKQNPFLYVCLGVIFYYSYLVFISVFVFSGMFSVSKSLWEKVWLIYVFFNVVCNLLFATAFVWIRKKERFI